MDSTRTALDKQTRASSTDISIDGEEGIFSTGEMTSNKADEDIMATANTTKVDDNLGAVEAITPEAILKNVYPTVTSEEDLRQTASEAALLKWGSRLELEALELKTTNKILQSQASDQKLEKLFEKLSNTILDTVSKVEVQQTKLIVQKFKTIQSSLDRVLEEVTKSKRHGFTDQKLQKAIEKQIMSKTTVTHNAELNELKRALKTFEKASKLGSTGLNIQVNDISQKLKLLWDKFDFIKSVLEQLQQPRECVCNCDSKSQELHINTPATTQQSVNVTPINAVTKTAPVKLQPAKDVPHTEARTRSKISMRDLKVHDVCMTEEELVKPIGPSRRKRAKTESRQPLSTLSSNKFQFSNPQQSLKGGRFLIFEDDVEADSMSG